MVRNFSIVAPAPARTAAPPAGAQSQAQPRPTNTPKAGNEGPANGKELPAPKKVEQVDLSKAIEQLTRLARSAARDLQFSVDEASGRTVITVINASTDEVVRQIPSEEVLALARNLGDLGTLIDAEA